MSAPASYLQGRLLHHALPQLAIPTPPDAPLLRRVALPQGELAQLVNGPEGIRYLATLQLLAGTVRGNHVHFAKRESVYLMSGSARLVARDLDSAERIELMIAPGDLVQIAPRVAHAFHVLADGWGVEFAPDPLDPSDTHRHPVDPS